MTTIAVPYGKSELTADVDHEVDVIAPRTVPPSADPAATVHAALAAPRGDFDWDRIRPGASVAIAINDKTRPVPHDVLLPPLVARLAAAGVHASDIRFVIATGAHPPLTADEFAAVVPAALLGRHPISSHDCDAPDLVHLGTTPARTPVWINRVFMSADLRIVVGNIEPHQFQGYSGGVKSAAIGLAGRETINRNHALMQDPAARLGRFDDNPARQDVEAIGALCRVDLALNAVLNDRKQLVHALAGTPAAVMAAGIPLARDICTVPVARQYDIVIAAPGGYPKDINVYQAQKGLAHAMALVKPRGVVILVAACPEGSGSEHYEAWVARRRSSADVLAAFATEGFRVGPHKAFQIARDASRVTLIMVSELSAELADRLLLPQAPSLAAALARAVALAPPSPSIAVMPWANATIPEVR